VEYPHSTGAPARGAIHLRSDRNSRLQLRQRQLRPLLSFYGAALAHFFQGGSMPDSLSASEYVLDNFKPSDRVAMLLRNRTTEEVIQRIASAQKIAAPDFQQW